ncbi:MAG: hypothetical protein JWM31_1560 [Solirubrobacterales bacterium]|nr:hypothetical protein [Solirubrobacterales bacterium]
MQFTPSRRLRSVLGLALTAGALVAATPPAASAAVQCDASALRGTVLGQATIEPVTANRGAASCRTAAAGGAAAGSALNALALPLAANVLGASTYITPAGTPNEKQAVLSQGGLAALSVKALPTLPITLPTAAIPAGLLTQSITVPPPLSTVMALAGLPTVFTIDLKPAVDALLPNGQLPNVELLSVGAATAYAGASCRNGAFTPFGVTQVADVKVLGQTIPTDTAAEQALSLIDTSSIDLSKIDITKIVLPPAIAGVSGLLVNTVLTPLLNTVIKPLVTALPKVPIPGTVANLKITPAGQTVANGTLTQRGPHVEVSILGQSIVDVILGEATIGGTAGVDCTPVTTPVTAPVPDAPTSAADLALECTTRRLVLVDVLQQAGRVKLLGAADRKLVGRTVSLRLAATGKTVATAKVAEDGSFSALAPLPARAIRNTNEARYQAVLGQEKSLDLKLSRRMIVSSLSSSGGTVRIAGRVILPLARPLASITLTRRVSCRKSEVVKRFKPQANGHFSVSVDAPEGTTAAVYRMSTSVRRTTRSNTTSPTFTLPRGVNLDR